MSDKYLNKLSPKDIRSLGDLEKIRILKNKKLAGEIKKLSYSVVQPLYVGIDSNNNKIEFTSSDIVSGKIKAKSIKKWRGKSLAERVMSKGFGKVKKRIKK
jgi:hypothetical protein|tara:strand:- start:6834 stop:7136 length:303 start_codon:yes stop_codon:yes gene_type:complete